MSIQSSEITPITETHTFQKIFFETKIIQTTPDGFIGADVVTHNPSQVVLIDGTGYGSNGLRTIAHREMNQVLNSGEFSKNTAGINIQLFEGNKIHLDAQGGGFCFILSKCEGQYTLTFSYIGSDTKKIKTTTEIAINPDDLILVLSDGGIGLFTDLVKKLPLLDTDIIPLQIYNINNCSEQGEIDDIISHFFIPILRYLNKYGSYTFQEEIIILHELQQQNSPESIKYPDDATLISIICKQNKNKQKPIDDAVKKDNVIINARNWLQSIIRKKK